MDAKKISILSAIAASSCCLPPLILLALTLLGIGTAGFAGFSTTLGSLKWIILPLAILGLSLSYYLYYRERKKCSTESCKMINEKLTKIMLIFSTILIVGFTSWSIYPYIMGSVNQPDLISQSKHYAIFQIDGMTCGGCEIAVNKSIELTGMVDSVKSNFIDSKAYIWSSEFIKDMKPIQDAIASVGYTSVLIKQK